MDIDVKFCYHVWPKVNFNSNFITWNELEHSQEMIHINTNLDLILHYDFRQNGV